MCAHMQVDLYVCERLILYYLLIECELTLYANLPIEYL